jgi:hypothetical protein
MRKASLERDLGDATSTESEEGDRAVNAALDDEAVH